jgi:hypothetical protein
VFKLKELLASKNRVQCKKTIDYLYDSILAKSPRGLIRSTIQIIDDGLERNKVGSVCMSANCQTTGENEIKITFDTFNFHAGSSSHSHDHHHRPSGWRPWAE